MKPRSQSVHETRAEIINKPANSVCANNAIHTQLMQLQTLIVIARIIMVQPFKIISHVYRHRYHELATSGRESRINV